MTMLLNVIHWKFDPILFKLGPLTVAWYGACFAAAFLLGNWLMKKMFVKENRNVDDLEALFIYMVVGTILGARLGHCFFYQPGYYFSHPLEIIQVWKGGLASHGGAIGIFLALFLFSKKYKYSYLEVLDRIVLPVALAGFFIRLGNFFNSEIVGTITDRPWGVVFENKIRYLGTAARHPAQMYESLCYLAIFVLLALLFYKKDAGNYRGRLLGIFLTLVFGCRFLIEFVKSRQADFGHNFILSMGQVLSLPMIILGLILLVRAKSLKTVASDTTL